ncbi:NLI_interacting factor-like phosphatase [Hexamita inflata]|uniref:protein-serine/threonine phosphatase n=1 Tax=Hexamita inflata TaxID=28002 RepID=A0AA86Q1Z6_9EUKA|nr:NLI interacting factor-like phosphatase [Hexamita inflata]
MTCLHFHVDKESKQCLQCQQLVSDEELEQLYVLNLSLFVKQQRKQLNIVKLRDQIRQFNQALLFLDVDNTILEAKQMINQQYVDSISEIRTLYDQCDSQSTFYNILSTYQSFSIQLDEQPIIVQFRPGFFNFLMRNLSKIHVVICTLGTYEYASKITQLFDPDFKIVLKILARNSSDCQSVLQTKSIHTLIGSDPLLLNRSIVLDDSSRPWSSPSPPVNFLKSVTFSDSVSSDSVKQAFIPPENVQVSFVCPQPINYSFLAKFQFTALENLIYKLRRLHIIDQFDVLDYSGTQSQQIIEEQFTFKTVQCSVFKGCVFFIPFNRENYQFKLDGEFVIEAYYNGFLDLRVNTILQFGGRVCVNIQNKEVTHLLCSQQITLQIVDKLKLSRDLLTLYQQNKDAFETQYLTKVDKRLAEIVPFGENEQINTTMHQQSINRYTKYQLVDQNFIFISAYLCRKQNEFWWTWAFLQEWADLDRK